MKWCSFNSINSQSFISMIIFYLVFLNQVFLLQIRKCQQVSRSSNNASSSPTASFSDPASTPRSLFSRFSFSWRIQDFFPSFASIGCSGRAVELQFWVDCTNLLEWIDRILEGRLYSVLNSFSNHSHCTFCNSIMYIKTIIYSESIYVSD